MKAQIEAWYNDVNEKIDNTHMIIDLKYDEDRYNAVLIKHLVEYDEDGNETKPEPIVIEFNVDATWVLILEQIDRCWPAIVQFAIGYDGSHLSFCNYRLNFVKDTYFTVNTPTDWI